ncbi:MAG TPA: hypothetical protein VEY93_04470 [Longimicrobium sp.]|nr:hypothetical protein [Longimicrobium sp.]
MRRMVRGLALAATLALGAGGCAGYGMEEVLNGGLGTLYGNEVEGEIRGVNTRSRYLEVRTYNGRSERVRYDGRTRVVYRDRQYNPSALERGDEVSIRTSRDRNGYLYADHVRVRHSRGNDRYDSRDRDRDRDRRDRDRDRYEDRVYSLDARVVRVSRTSRQMELRTSDGRRVWATLPHDSRDRDRFNRLREGDRVRLTGRYTSRERFVIERIR